MENAELQIALLRELAAHKEELAFYHSEIGPRTEHTCPVCNARIYGVLRGPVNPGQPFVHAECAVRIENEQLQKQVKDLQGQIATPALIADETYGDVERAS